MATLAPAPATSDAADPPVEDLPQAEAAPATEREGSEGDAVSAVVSGGAPNPSAVVVAVVAEGELLGDAAASNPAPAPDSTSTSSSAALPLPASATHADPRPPRPQFAGSPAYMATPGPVSSSAPSFSYNVVPWVPPPLQVGSGTTPHQPSSSLVGVLSFAASDMSVHAAMLLSMITCLVL
jgi:transcription elongation regulator 1